MNTDRRSLLPREGKHFASQKVLYKKAQDIPSSLVFYLNVMSVKIIFSLEKVATYSGKLM